MSTISVREYEEALRDWLGDRVAFRPGWETRTSAGGFDAHGMMHHWTAMGRHISPASQERLLADGRAGLPGPLCHLSPRRSGIVAVIAGPRANANHAGNGDADVYRRILAGDFDGHPEANADSIDGNERFYGLEYQYHPDDGTFPEEMFEAGVLATAALCEAHGWAPDAAAGSQLDHYEWTARKWDREVQNLANRTREGVRLALANKEDDMTPEQAKQLDDIHKWLAGGGVIREKLNRGNRYLRGLREKGKATRHELDQLAELLGADEAAGDDSPRR